MGHYHHIRSKNIEPALKLSTTSNEGKGKEWEDLESLERKSRL